MLYVTDDTDDLFRKAAEDYPLNTGNPDWEGLGKKMDQASPAGDSKRGKDNRFRYLVLLILCLLIPLLFLLNEKEPPAKPQLSENMHNKNSIPFEETGKNKSGNIAGNTGLPSTTGYNSLNGVHPSEINKFEPSAKDKYSTFFNNSLVNKGQGKSDKNIFSSVSKSNIVINTPDVTEGNASPLLSANPLVEKQNVTINKTQAEETNERLEKPGENNKNNIPSIKNKPGKKSLHFYAGIIAGPDITTVKLQSVKKAGFGFGLVTGFQFNERWSVETGLIADKKFYNTDGKYFNTNNITIPNYIIIDHADGSCNMLVIPLNIRYNFKKRYGSGWFASTGISTYLMKKEDYTYDLTRYGVTYSRKYTYRESRNTFSAVLNFGGGYSHRLGNMGHLRVEPYIKLPLRKVGIGDLPLQSAGIYIGFTKKIF